MINYMFNLNLKVMKRLIMFSIGSLFSLILIVGSFMVPTQTAKANEAQTWDQKTCWDNSLACYGLGNTCSTKKKCPKKPNIE
jgi:hypothetical protein